MRKIGIAICDANVLIDLANSDRDLIAEIVAYCGTVYVPDIVFRVFWGLETILLLVEEKLIAKKRAETAARKIRATNFEMDDTLLEEFLKRLSKL